MAYAIIYCRFSDRKEAELCQSNETQKDLCTAYCDQHGHEIVDIQCDEAISGAEEDRPVLWNAIASLRKGWVLVVYRSDRLARNLYLHELIYREVAKKKATIEIVNGSHNGTSAEDELLRGILAVFASYERKVTAARTKAAVLRHIASGRAHGKEAPYGKQEGPQREIGGKLRRTIVDDPAELEVVRCIGIFREQGMGLREIARKLNELEVPCRGRKWSHVTVGRILDRNGDPGAKVLKTVAQDCA